MIRIDILKDGWPYAVDYEAWLTGWVAIDGDIFGMVFTDAGDTPWEIPRRLIEMKV